LNKTPGIPVEFNNLKFEVGKYYYMYKRGRLNWGQKEYFENNMDSLTRIRGNDLPELPDLRLHKKDSLTLPEESIHLRNNIKARLLGLFLLLYNLKKFIDNFLKHFGINSSNFTGYNTFFGSKQPVRPNIAGFV